LALRGPPATDQHDAGPVDARESPVKAADAAPLVHGGWKCRARVAILTALSCASFRRTGVESPEITIYSTAICPYCVAAKNFLRSKGWQWKEVRIDTDPGERTRMVERARRTSVPQIFIGNHHVGGYDDMMSLHRAGKLEPLLSGGRA
jgi:glutaredoxin 3